MTKDGGKKTGRKQNTENPKNDGRPVKRTNDFF